MITVLNAVKDISEIYKAGDFQIDCWESYINKVVPEQREVFLNEMNEVLRTGDFSFEKDYLPVLNLPFKEMKKRERVISAFEAATSNIENRVKEKFSHIPDVKIVLYLGLCNELSYIVRPGNKCILLALEKIMELDWCDSETICGLIYHDLGHIYQYQFGLLKNNYTGSDKFLWQLFTEGIAMFFEQTLANNPDLFHQNKNGWLEWCKKNYTHIKQSFYNDLSEMTYDTQRYFGEWALFEGYNNTGYYLGDCFVKWLAQRLSFDQIISFDISDVKKFWKEFQNI